jgi:type II secretory pathway pseudopilin PulG
VSTPSGGSLLVAIAVIVVIAALVAGLIAIGPPSVERQRRLDTTRVENLAAIETSIIAYVRLRKTLPKDLTTLSQESGFSVKRTDPQSGAAYEYQVLGSDTYRLCAQFAADVDPQQMGAAEAYGLPSGMFGRNTWSHGAGRQCFDRHVDLGQHQ